MYPEFAEINNKKYKINTDFRTALECFEIVENEDIDDYERCLAIVYLLFDIVPENDYMLNKFLEKAKIYLQCGKDYKQQKNNEEDMDFKQDRSYIMSSFMSDYHIDLSKESLHFWQFIELLEGLTNECSLNRIRELRNYDLSKEKDPKRRREIKEAKEKVALKKKIRKASKKQKEEAIKMYEKLGLRKE